MRAWNAIDQEAGLSVDEWTPLPYPEPFHWHTELEIGCCLSGKGLFHFGDKTYEARPGDVFVVNNLERHIAQSDEHDPSRYAFVFFDPAVLLKENRELLLPFLYHPPRFTNRIPASDATSARIGRLVAALLEEQRERSPGYQTMMRSLLLEICVLLFRHYGDGLPTADLTGAYARYERIQPALAYMKRHFREDLQVANIASIMRLSHSRAAHVFAETVGEGFKEHLLHLRINEAKRLLVQTRLSVIEVCLQSGFQSVTPFYRAFRRIVGLAPQAYREMAGVLGIAHPQ
ncbi:AraC family transcriptional regulator [Cohnella nanjingensis]|uniref:AraC family transcriptional regulator n=1 Tax=Cohnella nanjingensis TaxID=1387779 RepID=A0A7X0RTY4_9BACL|nr:AraC family transcriptional regulator [Cohnella nanjingensis]MBB6673476.1 AraC family transcriptional regulator [Cohnella nanjingensis]